jgi:hypothetical protein
MTEYPNPTKPVPKPGEPGYDPAKHGPIEPRKPDYKPGEHPKPGEGNEPHEPEHEKQK